MKTAAIPLSVAFEVASAVAFAQGGSDPAARLRACSLMERAERLECREKLSRSFEPPARPAPGGDNWIVSETTSPVDYTPIVAAKAASHGGSDGSSMQLSIQCRGGRTELVVTGPAVTRRGEEYAISYRINDGQPVQLAAGAPSSKFLTLAALFVFVSEPAWAQGFFQYGSPSPGQYYRLPPYPYFTPPPPRANRRASPKPANVKIPSRKKRR